MDTAYKIFNKVLPNKKQKQCYQRGLISLLYVHRMFIALRYIYIFFSYLKSQESKCLASMSLVNIEAINKIIIPVQKETY